VTHHAAPDSLGFLFSVNNFPRVTAEAVRLTQNAAAGTNDSACALPVTKPDSHNVARANRPYAPRSQLCPPASFLQPLARTPSAGTDKARPLVPRILKSSSWKQQSQRNRSQGGLQVRELAALGGLPIDELVESCSAQNWRSASSDGNSGTGFFFVAWHRQRTATGGIRSTAHAVPPESPLPEDKVLTSLSTDDIMLIVARKGWQYTGGLGVSGTWKWPLTVAGVNS